MLQDTLENYEVDQRKRTSQKLLRLGSVIWMPLPRAAISTSRHIVVVLMAGGKHLGNTYLEILATKWRTIESRAFSHVRAFLCLCVQLVNLNVALPRKEMSLTRE